MQAWARGSSPHPLRPPAGDAAATPAPPHPRRHWATPAAGCSGGRPGGVCWAQERVCIHLAGAGSQMGPVIARMLCRAPPKPPRKGVKAVAAPSAPFGAHHEGPGTGRARCVSVPAEGWQVLEERGK